MNFPSPLIARELVAARLVFCETLSIATSFLTFVAEWAFVAFDGFQHASCKLLIDTLTKLQAATSRI